MARGNPPEGYCTATVARKKLGGISDGKFRSLITEGKIERFRNPGEKIGFYKISDVDLIAREINKQFREGPNPELRGAHFEVATKEDMPEIVELLIKVFGGGNTIEKRNAWLDRNPESAFLVRSRGRVVGCIFLLPLKEEKIWDLLSKEKSYSIGEIRAEDVMPYEVGTPANIFVMSLCSDKIGISNLNRRLWGGTLVRGLYRHIQDLGQRGIQINLIGGRSDLIDGIRLMRHMGFTEIEPIAGTRNFIIDVKRSGIGFIMKYKAALAEWKQHHA